MSDGTTWIIDGENARRLIEDAEEVSEAPDARIIIRKHGNSLSLQWAGTGYSGPEINDSHPCPGSPGCP